MRIVPRTARHPAGCGSFRFFVIVSAAKNLTVLDAGDNFGQGEILRLNASGRQKILRHYVSRVIPNVSHVIPNAVRNLTMRIVPRIARHPAGCGLFRFFVIVSAAKNLTVLDAGDNFEQGEILRLNASG